MEQEQAEQNTELVQISIRLERKVLRTVDLIYLTDPKKYISRERTIEYLIRKGMHQTF